MRAAFVLTATLAWLAATSLVPSHHLFDALGLLAITLVVLARAIDHKLAAQLRPSPATLGLGLVAGLAMTAATWAGHHAAVASIPPLTPAIRELYAVFDAALAPLLARTPLLGPLAVGLVIFAEEVVFRGLAIDTFTASRHLRDHPMWAAVFAAVPYALAQLGLGGPLLAATAFACGVVWGVLRVHTAGLVVPLVAHVVWDVVILGLSPLR